MSGSAGTGAAPGGGAAPHGDRVVVTGLGVLGATGPGREALVEALAAGRVRASEVDRSAGYHAAGSARTAGLVGRADLARWVSPLVARRMSPPSRFGLAAARMALGDAGLEVSQRPDPSLAVVMATAFGPTSFTQRLLDQILDEGPAAASPSVFTECVANAAASQIGIHCRARGASYTLAGREAGCLMAVARAAGEIDAGRADRALAGSVEELTPLLHAILDRFGSLARPGEGDRPERALPFDRRRDGFLAAEGAACLVLERAGDAARRGGRVLARVRGTAAAFDPTASRVGWGRDPRRLAEALRRGLDRCGVRPDEVELIVSGASGSRAGDRLEALTLRHAWEGRALPPVIAPKAVTGEYGGGFLAAAVLAAGGGLAGVSSEWFEQPDAGLDARPWAGGRLPAPPRCTLVTSLAAGGGASWLVLERA